MNPVDHTVEDGGVEIAGVGLPSVRGSVHSFDPSAKPVKLATVFGTSSSNNRALKEPSLVVKCACNIRYPLEAVSYQPSALSLNDGAIISLPAFRRLHRPALRRESAGAVFPDARGLSDGAMQADRQGDELLGIDVRSAAGAEPIPTFGFESSRLQPSCRWPDIRRSAVHSHLLESASIEPGRDRFVFGLGVGPTSVALRWKDAVRDRTTRLPRAPRMDVTQLEFAWMTQLNPTFSEPIRDRVGAAAILGLPESALALGLPPQVVSCGVPCLLVPLATRREVDRAHFDRSRVETILGVESRRELFACSCSLWSREATGPRLTAGCLHPILESAKIPRRRRERAARGATSLSTISWLPTGCRRC